MTRLDGQVAASTNFLIGISDVRGDGRPDYRYHAYVLYADSVSPARIGVNGRAGRSTRNRLLTGLSSAIAGTAASPFAISAGQIMLGAPPHQHGVQDVVVTDPATGSSSVMTGVLTYGAAESDNIILLHGLN